MIDIIRNVHHRLFNINYLYKFSCKCLTNNVMINRLLCGIVFIMINQ